MLLMMHLKVLVVVLLLLWVDRRLKLSIFVDMGRRVALPVAMPGHLLASFRLPNLLPNIHAAALSIGHFPIRRSRSLANVLLHRHDDIHLVVAIGWMMLLLLMVRARPLFDLLVLVCLLILVDALVVGAKVIEVLGCRRRRPRHLRPSCRCLRRAGSL